MTAQPVDYQAIFDERGHAYDQSMVEYPDARAKEFAETIRLASPRPGQVVCDPPSGGGYLPGYLPFEDCEVIAIETSETFYRICRDRDTCRAILTQLERIDLPDSLVDCVISLAGLHHLPDRAAFFREAHRILKPGGSHCVADVGVNTDVASFLNEFRGSLQFEGTSGRFFRCSRTGRASGRRVHRGRALLPRVSVDVPLSRRHVAFRDHDVRA